MAKGLPRVNLASKLHGPSCSPPTYLADKVGHEGPGAEALHVGASSPESYVVLEGQESEEAVQDADGKRHHEPLPGRPCHELFHLSWRPTEETQQ